MRTKGGGEDGIGWLLVSHRGDRCSFVFYFCRPSLSFFSRSLLSKAKSICDVSMNRQNIAI
jgi:hypothetical protein